MERIFWGRDAIGVSQWELGCHNGRLGRHSGRLGCHSGKLGCHSGRLGCHSGDWGVTVDGTMVVTVEGWFITVVGAWWGGSAEQDGQIKPLTSPRENMDLRVGPRSPEQVEWTHLLQRLHWSEVRPTSREQTEQGYMKFVGRTGAGAGLGWTLPLACRRRSIRRRVRGGE